MTSTAAPEVTCELCAASQAPEPVRKVREVANHLHCDEDTVYRLIAAGHLRVIRLGRVFRVPESSLADFIAGRS